MVKTLSAGFGALTMVVLLNVVWGYCPKGWIKAGQKCYGIFPPSGHLKTVDEADETNCRKNGGLLMNVKTRELNNIALDLMKSLTSPANAIMGLNDRETEGNFKWSDGTNLEESWINWVEDQPDNYAGFTHGEDCTQILPNGNWNDIPCQYDADSQGTLCEKLTEDNDVSLGYDRGYTGFYELRTGMFEIDSTVEMPSLLGCAVLCSRHDNCRGIHFRANMTSECVLLKESTGNDVINCELLNPMEMGK